MSASSPVDPNAHPELAAYLARNGREHRARPGTAASASGMRKDSERLYAREAPRLRRCYFCSAICRSASCRSCGAQVGPC